MPVVVILGRPNVGKSTLFNKLIKQRKAIVRDEPGVTRDRLYGRVEYQGKQFILIDTGGFISSAEGLTAKVQEQTRAALNEADYALFLMDGETGLTPEDRVLHEILRRSGKKSFYIVNKVDNPSKSYELLSEFYELGVDRIYSISAEHNLGLDELLEDLVTDMPSVELAEKSEKYPKIAIVGRPNVGKSSLINRILGMERVLVSEIPGTTRDTVDVLFRRGDKSYIFLDTSGLRRRSRIYSRLEILSSIKALRAIDESDISILLIDAVEGLVSQDLKICQFIFENGKGFVMAVNKWDLILKEGGNDVGRVKRRFIESIEGKFNFITHVPVAFISAMTGYGISELLDTVELVMDERQKKIKTSVLNRVIREALKFRQPPDYRNKEVKINYCTQIATAPPTFVLFTNYPEGISESYKRYLKNRIHEEFGFIGTDIRFVIRKK